MPRTTFVMPRKLYLVSAAVALTRVILADPNDFVNPKYVIAASGDPATKDARLTIVRSGNTAAKKGPWTITDSDIRASSNDPHDYLSWAPYHWPNCNWCGRTNSAEDSQSANRDYGTTEAQRADEDIDEHSLELLPSTSPTNSLVPLYARYQRGVDWDELFPPAWDSGFNLGSVGSMSDVSGPQTNTEHELHIERNPSPDNHMHPALDSLDSDTTDAVLLLADTNIQLSRMPLSTAQTSIATGDPAETPLVARDLPSAVVDTTPAAKPATPTLVAPTADTPSIPTAQPGSTTSSPDGVYGHSENPIRAHKPSKTASCTTSPTTSMKPSETWRTCPYKARDGRVNPDVRKLRNAAEVVDMSQAVLWNAIASVASGSASNAKNAAFFIDRFFLNDNTRMNPHAGYGQVVRGPPGMQAGSYMGVLDMRGLVKVVNAVLVLRETNSQYWTREMDTKMVSWADQYVKWVEASAVGKKAARAANNHGSFYPNQIAALKILMGDLPGAKAVLQAYFDNQFQEQVVASGEQPLEAVRTRPFHYRCFNLEAIITNAKLADYIGANFWDRRSKYGATIQTAVNYLMSLDPNGEKVEEALPHVAAVAAAYGDPKGTYAQYLKNRNRNYAKKPFWFYDQPAAIARSSAKPRNVVRDESSSDSPTPTTEPNVQASEVDQNHPPALFSDGHLVELEEGLFVSWEDVRDFYRRRRIPGERRRTRVKQSVPRQAPTPQPLPSIFQGGKNVELEDGIDVNWEDVKQYYEPSSDLP
ncbi:hypothetical protein FRC10_001866 [Ceratobasidium sp. 414]|nr:hypothetical protein FRC10_001866 [Ceratobasidium sp. 414]